MPRFYFNLETSTLVVDGEGCEMEHLHAVQIEAARSLVDMTRLAVGGLCAFHRSNVYFGKG
jgi:hypothetical protein